MDKVRIENIKKLERTEAICSAGGYIKGTKYVPISAEPWVEYINNDDLSLFDNNNERKQNETFVEDADTLGYVIKHKDEFKSRPLVLDFANPYTPGGGVRIGCRAQEEDLCRRSNLLQALESADADKYYSLNRYSLSNKVQNDLHGLIIHDVSVFVDSNGELLDEPIIIDVAVVAAEDRSRGDLFFDPVEYLYSDRMQDIIKFLLDMANDFNYTELILGAFGCGAFKNSPGYVAKSFKDAIDEGDYSFEKIAFAIPKHEGSSNYEEFGILN